MISQLRIRRSAVVAPDYAAATRSFAEHAYCVLPNAPAPGHAAALLAESTALAPTARRLSGDYYCVNADKSVSGPRRLSTVAAGPKLDAIHRDQSQVDLLRRIAGVQVSPTQSCYIYYEPGDFIGLHKDAAVCEVTLITSIAGALDPLVVHPSLIEMPPEELLATSRAHSAMPPDGIEVAVPAAGRLLMLLGSKIPHHRPATRGSCIIATLCYA